ncbi:glycosyltransferase family 2 protein [Paenibacillus sp. FSL R5-0887]|jgi:glycosyltransferase involved in cell wall biosynthesis|uniref:glycosyltransferase family 2 protein n=1 Tax=Paenibacillus sp. FSL R5-0887 TaxID=2921662 RepID=UPI0030F6FA51
MGVSAALIVKDSERCLARCLDSIVDAVDEVIVVDTGSSDRTVAIIESYQNKHDHVKLFHFAWINDFSAARNYSLSKVTNNWVFIVDSDDVLPEQDQPKVREYVNRMNKKNEQAVFDIVYDNTVDGIITESISNGYVRLFPSELRYEDKIHEQISFGTLKRIQSDIHLLHDGYDINFIDLKEKKKRNLNMLIESLKEDNDNARLWLHLGREMSVVDKDKARRYLDIAETKAKSIELIKWIQRSKEDLN